MCVYETGDELDNRSLARQTEENEKEGEAKRKKYVDDRLASVARFVQLLFFLLFFSLALSLSLFSSLLSSLVGIDETSKAKKRVREREREGQSECRGYVSMS